ncbi:MAG TPA: response regulator FixJ [Phenylobacterium sp.]|jgi:two-component system response regulator FixJ
MAEPVVHVVDDDEAIRESMGFLLDAAGLTARTYGSALDLLQHLDRLEAGCIVTDVRMPGMNGLELVRRLKEQGVGHPMIVITGHGDIPLAVEAMKAGVSDFLEKPFEEEALLRAIRTALLQGERSQEDQAEKHRLRSIFEALSPRERQVLEGVVGGKMNKVIAFELGISPRTVEVYRANMMSKTGAQGLSELVRMVLLAGE